jgi:hypothetical protein
MNDFCWKSKRALTLTFVVVTVGIVMLAGAVLWILNLEGIVKGSWADIFGVIFTFLGVLYALLQWYAQLREQRAIGMIPTIFVFSRPPAQDHRYNKTESITSNIIFSPLAETSSPSTILHSVIDNQPTPVVKISSTINEDGQNSPLSQKFHIIHIYIYPKK